MQGLRFAVEHCSPGAKTDTTTGVYSARKRVHSVDVASFKRTHYIPRIFPVIGFGYRDRKPITMYRALLIFLLLSSLGLAQATPPGQAQPSAPTEAPAPEHHDDDTEPPPSSAASVSPTTPVITIRGLCDNGSRVWKSTKAAGSDHSASGSMNPGCKTVITRAQFELLADSLNPQMAALSKRQLAEAYPRILLFAATARELGLDRDPHFQEMLRFASLRLLSEALTQSMRQKAGDISDAELQKYYDENPTKFERIELLRIFIPLQKQFVSGKEEPVALEETAMKAEAEKIHAAAAAGGDFQQLQQQAFEAAHLQSSSQNVSLGKLPIGRLPLDHQKVFELEPEQVSELISDSTGYYVYKVVSKEMTPLSQAKPEIRNLMQTQRMQASTDALLKNMSSEVNTEYFGAMPLTSRPKPAGQTVKPKIKN